MYIDSNIVYIYYTNLLTVVCNNIGEINTFECIKATKPDTSSAAEADEYLRQVLYTFQQEIDHIHGCFFYYHWEQTFMFIMDGNINAYATVFHDKSAHTLDVLPCTWNFLLSRLTFDFNVATPLQYHVTNNNVWRNTRKSVAFQVQRRQLKLSTVIDSY